MDSDPISDTLNSAPEANAVLSHGPAQLGKPLLRPAQVAVWWLGVQDRKPQDWQALESLLSEPEKTRAARFHFERDRHSFILAHALCRGLLTYCTGQSVHSHAFDTGDHGKPEVIVPAGAPRLRINISHTHGMAAAALTLDCDIGLDVEATTRDVDALKLAEHMFAPREYAVLARAPAARLTETFLAFWTLKEAYVKAIGKGLSQPLQAFSFDLATCAIWFDDTLADKPETWRFERLRPGAEHIMALGVRHPDPASLSIDARPAPVDYLLSLGDATLRR